VTTAAEALAELRVAGLSVRAEGDRLMLRPAERLTAELKARVLVAKPELLRLLGAPAHVSPLDHGLAVGDVLSFPAALLGDLPLPTTLVLEAPGVAEPVTVGTHPGCPPATFGAAEWLALVLAAECARTFPEHFGAWLARKRRDPRWQLAGHEALGAVFDASPQGWTVARVLRQLGVTLRAVAIEGAG
jgi:hypothetical protein